MLLTNYLLFLTCTLLSTEAILKKHFQYRYTGDYEPKPVAKVFGLSIGGNFGLGGFGFRLGTFAGHGNHESGHGSGNWGSDGSKYQGRPHGGYEGYHGGYQGGYQRGPHGGHGFVDQKGNGQEGNVEKTSGHEGDARPYGHGGNRGSHRDENRGGTGPYGHRGNPSAYGHGGGAGPYGHRGNPGSYGHGGDVGPYGHRGSPDSYDHGGDAGPYGQGGNPGSYGHGDNSGPYGHDNKRPHGNEGNPSSNGQGDKGPHRHGSDASSYGQGDKAGPYGHGANAGPYGHGGDAGPYGHRGAADSYGIEKKPNGHGHSGVGTTEDSIGSHGKTTRPDRGTYGSEEHGKPVDADSHRPEGHQPAVFHDKNESGSKKPLIGQGGHTENPQNVKGNTGAIDSHGGGHKEKGIGAEEDAGKFNYGEGALDARTKRQRESTDLE